MLTSLTIGSKDDLTRLFDKNIATNYQLNTNQEISFEVKNKKEIAILTEMIPHLSICEYNEKNQIIKSSTLNDNSKINAYLLTPNTSKISIKNNDSFALNIAEIIIK